jgi:hypothetical protein
LITAISKTHRQYFNSAVIVSNGDVIGVYRKTHLENSNAADKGHSIKVILDFYELCKEQLQRVSKPLLADNHIQAGQWANDVDEWLYKHQSEITPYYMS